MKKTFMNLLAGVSIFAFVFGLSACKPNVDDNKGAEEVPYVLPTLPDEPLAANTTENAADAVSKMKSGVNLGNGLDSTSFNEEAFLKGEKGWIIKIGAKEPADWEKAWGQPVTTKELIKGIKDAGFGAVRVPVTWAEHMDFETGKVDEAWMNRVKEVVDWVLDEGLYCLLNTHHDGGTDGWVEASDRAYEKYKEVYSKLYVNIANQFKDYSEKLILCGTNEMISAGNDWGSGSAEATRVVNQWNQLFVNCVRSTGGKNASRNLMVGTYVCSSVESDLKAFVKPKDNYDNHLIMEVHIYAPVGFVWQKEDWISDWGTEWKTEWEAPLATNFTTLKTYADKYGMPVIIGEWGTLGRRFPGKNEDGTQKWDSTTDEEGAKFTSYFIKQSRDRGFTSFYWDTQEIVDRKTGTVTSPQMLKGICDNY